VTAAPTRPAERYGDAGPWRRRVRTGVVVLVAAVALVWLLWVALSQARQQQLTFDTQGHQVLDDSRIVVTFTVTQPVGDRARCHIKALSSGAAQVGLAVVDVGPSPRPSTRQQVTVRTQQRAVTGSIDDCTKI
jgi:Domain of unknown function (DUF4307)